MDNQIEKLLYSREDAAAALSISIRSVDYLIAERKLSTRRIGRKILIPAGDIKRFARADHPERIRTSGKVRHEEQLYGTQ
jgi:excisionase family DNA binding protein